MTIKINYSKQVANKSTKAGRADKLPKYRALFTIFFQMSLNIGASKSDRSSGIKSSTTGVSRR
jgi:hypothetical protein